ncbi:MAG: AAA family ATPase, partial [Sulfurovaceae bacterium]|nr:AAA family ATPase [Sulfurovaceae bacterium]
MKNPNKQKLPIGISTFSQIRDENYLYIDKTKEAYELITNYKYTFLSRPRRFGKSLFLDTLKEIFEGNKKLFEGLYIYDKWDWEDKYPVITISFSGDLKTPNNLKNRIQDILISNQKNLQVECNKIKNYDSCFQDLIRETYQKYNKRVVILIDEYDKAILDNLENIEIAEQNREILRAFYGIMKDNDRYIKF